MTQTPETWRTVAVVDVGSNTIKSLVARRGADGALEILDASTRDTRIFTGLGRSGGAIAPDAFEAGLESVRELMESAGRFSPGRAIVLATSAAREASNGAAFIKMASQAAQAPARILSGEDEARLSALGAAQDPALQGRDFFLFDIGGGSLELIERSGGAARQTMSLPLGAVRMTERFAADKAAALSAEAVAGIGAHAADAISRSGFSFEAGLPLCGTGGAINFARILLADEAGGPPLDFSPELPLKEIERLAARLCSQPLSARARPPLLPESRAEILPAGLLVCAAVARAARATAIVHTFSCLRHGAAAELLDQMEHFRAEA